jgi:hypothetical protein
MLPRNYLETSCSLDRVINFCRACWWLLVTAETCCIMSVKSLHSRLWIDCTIPIIIILVIMIIIIIGFILDVRIIKKLHLKFNIYKSFICGVHKILYLNYVTYILYDSVNPVFSQSAWKYFSLLYMVCYWVAYCFLKFFICEPSVADSNIPNNFFLQLCFLFQYSLYRHTSLDHIQNKLNAVYSQRLKELF